MKNLRRFLSCLLAVTMLLALGITAYAAEFTDVPAGSDYAEAVQWASNNGYIYGYGDGRFGVNDNVTRAQLATIFHRAAGTPAASGTSRFSDAEAGAYYINALSWAENAGLIAGYPDGRFGVNDPVTRQQVATILWRWAGSPAASAENYADENAISAYAQTAVDWSRSNGIIDARSDGRFAPTDNATRGEIVSALYNYMGKTSTPPASTGNGKILVAYFSASGNTEAVANAIADTLDADLFELIPESPYTSADLNWTDSGSRVNAEHDDPAKQDVKLADTTVDNWADYDTVFIGYPIWWGIAAWPVNDFVKNNDFTGKTVIPFCTSTSSGLGQSGELLKEMAGTGNWQEGRRFTERASQSDIAAWANGLDLPKADTQPAQSGESKVLVAYFSMPETTNPNNMTTEEANSTVVIDGEVLGNTQYMAQVIQRTTNADIYRIEPQTPYPTDHTTLVDQARDEQNQDTRPAIKDSISSFDSYDTIFIGYPIWWSDLPQILYTFFDTYDFSGKTVIPFSTHGGSSFAGTPATIQRLEPNAKMLDGLTISRNSIQDAEQEIITWVNGLNY
ncbi:flavodoxin [uncultured Oscillibacter sp.]|uniref:flavodoxin n=1 Tax=uncultured Oscillibacter sp. TaxID=876091 RepID=UPI00345C2F92